MGFLDGLGRLITGTPAFQAKDGTSQTEQPAPASHRFIDERGYKIIPKVTLTHTKSNTNGKTMIVTVWATNQSTERIRLDYFVLLGQKRTILEELAPGRGREVKLYDGQSAEDEHTSKAELVFRLLANGDVFSDTYFVEFDRTSDGVFLVEDFHPDNPTRDI